MPYRSEAQRRFFHTDTARRQGISQGTVREFDSATRGRRLPERATSGREDRETAMNGIRRAMRPGK